MKNRLDSHACWRGMQWNLSGQRLEWARPIRLVPSHYLTLRRCKMFTLDVHSPDRPNSLFFSCHSCFLAAFCANKPPPPPTTTKTDKDRSHSCHLGDKCDKRSHVDREIQDTVSCCPVYNIHTNFLLYLQHFVPPPRAVFRWTKAVASCQRTSTYLGPGQLFVASFAKNALRLAPFSGSRWTLAALVSMQFGPLFDAHRSLRERKLKTFATPDE